MKTPVMRALCSLSISFMLCSITRRRRREWRTEYSDSLLHFSAGCLLFLYQVQHELEHSLLKQEVVPDFFELLFYVLLVMSQVLVCQLKASCSSQHYIAVLCSKWSHGNTKSLHMNSDFCFNIRQARESGNISFQADWDQAVTYNVTGSFIYSHVRGWKEERELSLLLCFSLSVTVVLLLVN